MKKIIVLLIKCLSGRKVSGISAPDKAARTDLVLCSRALKSADKTALGGRILYKDREQEKKEEEVEEGRVEGGRWISSFHSQQDVVCDCRRPPTWEQQQRQAVYLSTLAY